MIQARMTELNYNEILMYLGHRGQLITPEIETQIASCIATVTRAVAPRVVYQRVPLENGQIPLLPIEGDDIRTLFAPCREAVLMAVTLGAGIEQVLMRREVCDMADAVIMDACASVAVENVCDCFEEDMRTAVEAEGLFLSSRFSPGYGDVPLYTQKKLCEILNTTRRIGLTVTDNFLMVPRKSVTALMGIADTPLTLREKGCEACNMFLTCSYRKDGTVCHA